MTYDAMQQRARVLCFSSDQSLLETRGEVLATLYQTVTIKSLEEIFELPPDMQFDAVVLCHSLSANECGVATAVVRQRWPEARILKLAANQLGCSTSTDRIFPTADGPAALLRAVDSLIRPSMEP